MIPLSIRSRTTLFLLLSTAIALSEARIKPNVKKPFQLILTQVQTATFAFYIIFGLTTLFQSFSAFLRTISAVRDLGRRAQSTGDERDVTTGVVCALFVFLGACSSLVYDVLSTVWIVFAQNQFKQRVIPDAFYSGKFAMSEGADFLICFAMLALIYHRARLAYGNKAEEMYPFKLKLCFDVLLLLAYLASIIVYAALRSVYSTATNVPEAYSQLLTITRVVIGIFCALAVNVTVSSIWAWLKLKHISQPDSVILGQIVKFISPMLILRGVFKVVEYVLTFNNPSITPEYQDSIRLARSIIMGTTYFIILIFAL